jgi:hypothetical protein
MVSDFDYAISLLGQQVRVTLDNEGGIVSEGKLVRISDGGEVVVVDDMGLCHYCWPMLKIEKA